MTGLLATWFERVRRHLLAGVEADIAGLRREIEAQRGALREAESLRPLIAGLEARAGRPPEEIAAELRPFIEEAILAGLRAQRRRTLALIAGGALVAAGGLWWWRSGVPLISLAGRAEARAVVAAPAAALPAPAPASLAPSVPPVRLVLDEDAGVFGLGRSSGGDAELAAAVRSRLAACTTLAGAEIRFAAKDGWVWLRGRASRGGREAAGEVLADLGEGVVVVNQIETAPADLLAER